MLRRRVVPGWPLLAALLLVALPGCEDGDGPDDDDSGGADDDDDTTPDSDECTVDDPECVDWRFVTDDLGRARVLHGLNVDGNAKGDGLPSITEVEVAQLSAEYGFNHARYLIFWSQIEPEQGIYDEAYLDEVDTRLDWLADAGITVVLDMHQDCWGDTIYQLDAGDTEPHGANGAPMWATVIDDEPHTQPEGFWSLCYISRDVIRAFDNFWDHDGHPELQDHYAAMWANVAARFADHPAVIGYDVMNEPWEGSYVLDQETFDETAYHAFLQRVIDAIRTEDDDAWVFYEPRAFGPNQAEPSWLPRLDDPRDGDPHLVYYPHFYPVAYETGYDPASDGYIDQWQGYRAEEQDEHRAPMLVGEYSTLPCDDEAEREAYFLRMNTMLDATTSGWAFWDRGLLHATLGEGDLEVLDYLVRVYPRAVAGQPVEYGFDTASREFTLTFESRAKVEGPTEIAVPAMLYPDGWTVEVGDPEGSWSSQYDEATGVLTVETDPTIESHTITVSPAG
jgi:endoglycosylceramidase